MREGNLKFILLSAGLLIGCKTSFAQELVPYTDTVNHFRLSTPNWRPIPQDAKSNIKLYLYDSSSASGCTAQTSLMVKVGKSKIASRNFKHVAITAPDSLKGTLANGANWSVHSDSVVCRPGELDYKIQKKYVTVTYFAKGREISLVGTAENFPAMLPQFLRMAESIEVF